MSLAVKLKMGKMRGALMPLQYHTEVGRLGGNGARVVMAMLSNRGYDGPIGGRVGLVQPSGQPPASHFDWRLKSWAITGQLSTNQKSALIFFATF